jgi:chloride channel protein, CIC family
MSTVQSWFSKGTPLGLLLLSFVVGVGGALGAALFHGLIVVMTAGFFGASDDSRSFVEVLQTMPLWQRLLIPTIGGLFVGVIFKYSKVNEAEGEGVPEVMEALAHKRGTIRPIVAPIKILTAAITLGSGGSAGREGPVIQIGSAIGSNIAQLCRLDTPNRSLLLAAGAAAAIGGAFGAPIAGVLFTIEILRQKPNILRAVILILAAFTGAIGARLLTGYEGLRFTMDTSFSLDLIAGISILTLGLVASLVALLFGYILSRGRDFFTYISIPHVIKPAFGGLAIGMVGLFLPYIHEPATYPLMVDLVALGGLPLSFILLFLFVKMCATSITLGSGGSGGIFAPLLLMGALTGSILASLVVFVFPAQITFSPVLIFAGMASVFAAAAHAPFTATVILYEMTGSIALVIPLLVTCLIATSIAKKFKKESLYHHDT